MATQGSLFINELYLELEAEMLENIGKKLAFGQTVTKDNVLDWQVQKLTQLGPLQEEQIAAIAKASGKTNKVVKEWIKQEIEGGVGLVEDGLVEAFPDKNVPLTFQSNNILQTLTFFEQNAIETFNLVNTTMLTGSTQAYLDIISKSTAKVLTGMTTHTQALRDAGREWAEKGMPALIDKAGRAWSPEAYINLVTRTISSQVTAKVQEARYDDYDIDLVEISSHKGSRPTHFEYQGKVYSRSGKSKKYPALSTTSYGEGYGGLITGVNCGHTMAAFVNGVSIRRENPYKKRESDKEYALSQEQRALEVKIRKRKQVLSMSNAMKDSDGMKVARELLREEQAKMRQFIERTGRTRRPAREQIIKG